MLCRRQSSKVSKSVIGLRLRIESLRHLIQSSFMMIDMVFLLLTMILPGDSVITNMET